MVLARMAALTQINAIQGTCTSTAVTVSLNSWAPGSLIPEQEAGVQQKGVYVFACHWQTCIGNI